MELLQDREQSILFSTHITSDLERVAQRVAILGDGKIRFQGELDELKDRVKRLRITSRHELPVLIGAPDSSVRRETVKEGSGCSQVKLVIYVEDACVKLVRAP